MADFFTWIFDRLNVFSGQAVDVLYGYILIILLVFAGIYFTIKTKFVSFRLLKEKFRAVTEKPKDGKGVSSFHLYYPCRKSVLC